MRKIVFKNAFLSSLVSSFSLIITGCLRQGGFISVIGILWLLITLAMAEIYMELSGHRIPKK